MKLIVYIHGKKQSGKDTVANLLIEQLEHDLHGVKYAYGDPLKIVVCDLIKLFYGIEIDIAEFYQEESKERKRPELNGMSLRDFMQSIGTDIFRKRFDDRIWIDKIVKQIDIDIKHGTHNLIIITDCRFGNEWFSYSKSLIEKGEDVKEIGIWITRQSIDDGDNHPSEQPLIDSEAFKTDYPQFIIKNDGTLNDLKQSVFKISQNFEMLSILYQ
jgi:hypothetical protein